MKRFGFVILAVLTAAQLLEGAWFNTCWTHRRPITVTTTTSATPTDYQILVTLTTAIMGNPYTAVNTDGSDIRFTNSDGTTEIDFWVESWDNTDTSEIWVELPDAIPSSSTDTIYIYYGNPSASSASNGDNTFLFFDDFSGDLSKWTEHIRPENIDIVSGYLAITGGTTSSPYGFSVIGSDATYSSFTDGVIEAKYSAATDALPEFIFRGVYASNTGYKARYDCRDGSEQPWMMPPYNGWSSFGTSITRCGIDDGSWNKIKVTVNGTSFEMFQNDVSEATVTDATYAGPGEVGVANHYGSWIHVDDFRVRKYASPEPNVNVNSTAEQNSGDFFLLFE